VTPRTTLAKTMHGECPDHVITSHVVNDIRVTAAFGI
jgi:hypothetical protein